MSPIPAPGTTPPAPPPPPVEMTPEIRSFISSAVEAGIAPYRVLFEKSQQQVPAPTGEQSNRGPITGKEASEGTGLTMIGVALCKARAQMATGMPPSSPELVRAAHELAKKRAETDSRYIRVKQVLERQPQVTGKTLTQDTLTAGGAFVRDDLMVQEWIELLRNMTIIRRAGPASITLSGEAMGAIRLPRQTGAATAYYIGEATAVLPSQQTTDQVVWSPKKLMALTPVSNELIRHAGIDAEVFVRDDLLRVQALQEDLYFLRGTGSANAVRGIRYLASYSDAETVAVTGAPTLDEVEAELQGSMKKLETANILMMPGAKPFWFFAANAKYLLKGLRNGLGQLVYEPEMSTGKLKGYPFLSTQQIPENLGGTGDLSELYLVDMNHVVIIDWLTTQLEFFPNGSWANESGIVQSGISQDSSVMRSMSEHDLNMRHNQAARVVTSLSWGQ